MTKIVQSFWSKPCLQNRHDGNHGGWVDKKYHYFSWAFSALQLSTFYDDLELVTDRWGKTLLIDHLALPYTTVKVELDRLAPYPAAFWALGKIYAYSIQEHPFIHIDSDAYIWQRFEPRLETAPLMTQSKEFDFPQLYEVAQKIEQAFPYLPACYKHERKHAPTIQAYNAGIIGGHDLAFFKEYTTEVFRFVDHNRNHIHHIPEQDFGVVNVLYEQFLLHCLAKEKGTPVTCLISEAHLPRLQPVQMNYRREMKQHRYLHAQFSHKQTQRMCQLLERWLKLSYPDTYYRILHLLKTFRI